jgi:hypothetical protein
MANGTERKHRKAKTNWDSESETELSSGKAKRSRVTTKAKGTMKAGSIDSTSKSRRIVWDFGDVIPVVEITE